MRLSIITINLNNASGLRKTIESVVSQSSSDFEYIVIDGGSTDGSIEIIKEFADRITYWVSEPDEGIYQAMNKGILQAKGEYCQFLNSGDWLVANDVIARMLHQMPVCEIFYGNMLKPLSQGSIRDRGFAGRKPTMHDFYVGTLNHSPAFISRSLFKIYGLYDEKLKIVSDWKWYLDVIILKGIVPAYINIDVVVFDMKGISNSNSVLDKFERNQVLTKLLPASVLEDYKLWTSPVEQLMRINRYIWTRKLFWLVDRILFKWEKIFSKIYF